MMFEIHVPILLIFVHIACGNKGFILKKKAFYLENVEATSSKLANLMQTTCSTTEITVAFSRQNMQDLGISHNQLTLNEATCAAEVNQTHYFLSMRFADKLCGLQLQESRNKTVFKNTVIVSPPKLLLSRVQELQDDEDIDIAEGSGTLPAPPDDSRAVELTFQCEYTTSGPAATTISPSFAIPTRVLTRPREVISEASGSFELEFYTTDTYVQQLQLSSSLNILRGTSVYAQVAPSASSPYEKAFIHSCYIINSENHNHSAVDIVKAYHLISDGCIKDQSAEFKGENYRLEPYRRFLFRMKRVFHTFVTVHCEVEPCYINSPKPGLRQCTTQEAYCSSKPAPTTLYHISWKRSVIVGERRGDDNSVFSSPSETSTSLKFVANNCPPWPLSEPVMCNKCPKTLRDEQPGETMVSLTNAIIMATVTLFLGIGATVAVLVVHNCVDPRRRMQAVQMSEDGGSQNSHTPIKLIGDRQEITESFGR